MSVVLAECAARAYIPGAVGGSKRGGLSGVRGVSRGQMAGRMRGDCWRAA